MNSTSMNMLFGVELELDQKAFLAKWEKIRGEVGSTFGKTMGQALKAGFSSKALEPMRQSLFATMEKVKAQQVRIGHISASIQEKIAKGEAADAEKLILLKEKAELDRIEKAYKAELKSIDRVAEKRLESLKAFNAYLEEGAAEAGQKFAEEAAGMFDDLKGGKFDAVFKKIGQLMQGGGAKAAGTGRDDKAGKAIAGMGQMLMKVGKVVLIVGAVVGAIAAVAAAIVDADSRMKELNKTLLDGGVAAADLADKYGDVTKNLNTVREAFTNFDGLKNNLLWGTTAKDHMAILGAYADAGLTFKEIAGGIKDAEGQMQKFRQATAAALTYSKLLGMSTEEIAGNMAEYMEELGLTLLGVQERFSAVSVAARDSGFATKRFFGMLLQATSGMSMYNVRLEEAAGLLIQLGKVLGEKMGGDFLQSLTRGFKDEGAQDRIKKTLTTGVGVSTQVLQKEAIKGAQEFQRQLKDLAKDNAPGAEMIREALASVGIDKNMGDLTDPKQAEALAKALSKLSVADRGKLAASAQASGNAGMARMLDEAVGKSQAFRGGLGGAQAARQYAGPAASLLLQLNEMLGVNGRRLDEIADHEMEAIMAAENITGKQAEELRKLQAIGRDMAGRHKVMSEYQARIKAATSKDEQNRLAKEFNDKFSKSFGVSLTAGGHRMDSTTGLALEDSFEDLMLNVAAKLDKEASDQVSEDIALARIVADNTTDMAQVLESGVEFVLNKIFNAVQAIRNWLVGDLSKSEKEAKVRLQDKIGLERELLLKNRGELSGQIADEGRKLSEGRLSPEERKEVMARIETLNAEKQRVVAALKINEEEARRLRELTDTKGWFTSYSLEEMENKVRLSGKEVLELLKGVIGEEGVAAIQEKVKAAGDAARKDAEAKNRVMASVTPVLGPDGTLLGGGGVSIDVERAAAKAEEAAMASALEEFRRASFNDEEGLLKDQSSTIIKGFQKTLEDAETAKLVSALAGAGVVGDPSELMRISKSIRGGRVGGLKDRLSPEVVTKLLSDPSTSGLLGKGGALLSGLHAPPANDLVLQIGRGGIKYAQRVDENDVGVFAKPGGALSKAGGGGGGKVVHNHFYNDGQGIWNSLRKYEQAMGRG